MKTFSRQKRLFLIKEFIKHKEVRTQEELLNYLKSQGFKVTQATVSRDISEIGLQKKGTGYYVLEEEIELRSIFKTLVKKINSSLNIVLINTVAGAAQTVGRYIDSAKISGVLGSVAGDDTIFLLVSENVSVQAVVKKLRSFRKE